MKIAVPTKGNIVDEHFGHCEYYTLITVDESNNIVRTDAIEAASGCGCKSGIAEVLRSNGVTVMLAGGIGAGAVNVLSQHGIEVFRGCSGNTHDVVKAFIEGKITDSGSNCAVHNHGHEHGHSCSH